MQGKHSGMDVGPVALDMAQEELLALAHEKQRERNCSLLEAIGLVVGELEQKVRNEESIAHTAVPKNRYR